MARIVSMSMKDVDKDGYLITKEIDFEKIKRENPIKIATVSIDKGIRNEKIKLVNPILINQ